MFANMKYLNKYSLYYIDISIDKYKNGILKELYLKMVCDKIEYCRYYNSEENKYYWDLMKHYENTLKILDYYK